MPSKGALLTALFSNLVLCFTVGAQPKLGDAPSTAGSSAQILIAPESGSDDSTSSTTENTPLPLCGVYCLYAYTKLIGRDVQIEALIDTADVNPTLGVSLAQLLHMTTEIGLHAMPLKNLTEVSLRRAPSPMILHLKGLSSDGPRIDHYILFLGVEGAFARIYDPPKPAQLIPISELTRRWRGIGVLLSEDPIPSTALYSNPTMGAVSTLLVSFLILLGIHHLRRWLHPYLAFPDRRRAVASACISCILIASVAILAGLLFHLLSPHGLFAASQVQATVQSTSFRS